MLQTLRTTVSALRRGSVVHTTHLISVEPGVALATDVFRPKRCHNAPVVLIRTPYARRGPLAITMLAHIRIFLSAGFTVVLQDVRGRGDSGGEFVGFIHEAHDAEVTVQWVLDQSWCNGQIGAWGISYVGYTAWAAAASLPGAVSAVAVGMSSAALGLPDARGVYRLDMTLRWLRALEITNEASLSPALLARIIKHRFAGDTTDLLLELPLNDIDTRVFGKPSPVWESLRDQDPNDDLWRSTDHRTIVGDLPNSAFLSGWYDVFLHEESADHDTAVSHSADTSYVVGPWGHVTVTAQLASAWQARQLFLRAFGTDNVPDPACSLVHITAPRSTDGVWIRDLWETQGLPGKHRLTLTFATKDGSLTPSGVSGTATGTVGEFTFDPACPTPTYGGRLMSTDAGPFDAAPLCQRDDVVTLTTASRLHHDVVIAGAPTVTFDVTCDRPCADFVVWLCVVNDDDTTTAFTEGICRVHDDVPYRGSVTVELHRVARMASETDRLRIVLAGGSFPMFDRNLGFLSTPYATTWVRTKSVISNVAVHVPTLRGGTETANDHAVPTRTVLQLM